MEVHKYLKDNAFNVYNTFNALDTTTAIEEDLSQPVQIKDIKMEKN